MFIQKNQLQRMLLILKFEIYMVSCYPDANCLLAIRMQTVFYVTDDIGAIV
jgi:hypothetical protein